MTILNTLQNELKLLKNLENQQILLFCLVTLDFMKQYENQQHFSQLQSHYSS